MIVITHAEWCEYLNALGVLDEDHDDCRRAPVCVAPTSDEAGGVAA
jgi:hypothetical protein